jgi:alkylation response protein AidB-like acyl-CoA dehydrogenase
MQNAKTKLLHAVRELAPAITARIDEMESGKRLPPDLVAKLKEAGFFRMFVPGSYRGEDLDLLSGLEVHEALARVDGSAGWTVMLGSETPHLLSLLPRPLFEQVYAQGPDIILGGAFNAQGHAEQVDGGWRVTGRWNFSSGCQHANYLLANCVLLKDGKPLPGPMEGVPAIRAMLFPANEVRIVDNWSVLGLRGTGSHDLALEAAFCPAERTLDIFQGVANVPGPHFVAPVLHCAVHMGAVAVGIAQGALDETVQWATSGKKRLYARGPLTESPVVHLHLGRAEAQVRAARAALRDVSTDFWAACQQGTEAVTPQLSAQVMATLSLVAEMTSAAVDACYRVAGGSAVRDASPLQRRFRDIHTLAQHGAISEGWFSQMGGAMFGKPVTFSY